MFKSDLDLPDRLVEILFGLVMVMTVTLSARFVVADGTAGARQLLLAAVGCNIAWGIIDAMMYLMSVVTSRRRGAYLASLIRAEAPGTALTIAEHEIEARLGGILRPATRRALAAEVVETVSGAPSEPVHLGRGDIWSAFVCFLLVFLSCLPAALPFILLSDPTLALRVSNLMLLAMLFMAGRTWAFYIGVNPWLAGFLATGFGMALVAFAILFGG